MRLHFRSQHVANRYFRRFYPRAHYTYRSALDHVARSNIGFDKLADGLGNEFYVSYQFPNLRDIYEINLIPIQ